MNMQQGKALAKPKICLQRHAGNHKIAVKVVDGEGLENIEIVELKINGKVERN